MKPWYRTLTLTCLGWLLTSHPALAALPATVAPTGGAAAGNYLETFKQYAKDGGLVIGLILATGALIWIGYHLLQDLHQVRTGRKEMGDLALSTVAGGGVLLLVMFLANEAATVI